MKILAGILMAAAALAQTIPTGTLPMAAVTTPDKKLLLVVSAGYEQPGISVIDIATAKEIARVPVPDAWLGLVINKAGDRVYVGGGARGAVFEYILAAGVLKPGRTFTIDAQDFIGDVQLSPDGRLLYAASLNRDAVVVLNPQSGLMLSRFKTGRRPYRILFHPSGKMFYVTSWADGTIGTYDTANGSRTTSVRVGPHPTDMVWRTGTVEDQPSVTARLFVSAGGTNNLYVFGANEVGILTRNETVNLSLTASQPLGTTPSGLSLSADGKTLYVACSGTDAVAVIDVSGPRSYVRGFLSAEEYPTAAVTLPEGRVGVLNAASVQFADPAEDHTAEIQARLHYSDEVADTTPLPAGDTIKHVVYVVKGREAAGPNLRKIAAQFVTLANCGAPSPSGAIGLLEAVAGMAPDYTRRLAPATEAARRRQSDFEWQEPANTPAAGYLWSNAAQAGITMRNYGFFVENLARATADGQQVATVHDPTLAKDTDMEFRGLDKAYSDKDRVADFTDELKDFDQAGTWPQLLLVRMQGDDDAVGTLVEAVSRSKFWNETAIFIVPDSGTGCYLASPWAKHQFTDTTKYTVSSALRTIEVLLGLHPLTIRDAAAIPMSAAFSATAVSDPFNAEKTRN